MACAVAVRRADYIVSPLGLGSDVNYAAVKAGRSALALHEDPTLAEPFVASLLAREAVEAAFAGLPAGKVPAAGGYTFFEKMLIVAAAGALRAADTDGASPDVLFIVSTTKGNVELLSAAPDSVVLLGGSARRVSAFFGNPNEPVVVSNACISGLCAQIEAMRHLQNGRYRQVVVVGGECQPPFIVAGFQSFKALSMRPCRPFDRDREGLNIGEAAAAIVYTAVSAVDVLSDDWVLACGAVRNDANHISGPSRTGEGCYRALWAAGATSAEVQSGLAFINVHGTATLYNDEMEAIALQRAGLTDVPVCGLKGYYGHTMGAAGILETILSMRAVDDHTVLGTRGYATHGVSVPLDISAGHRSTDKRAFVKMLSGFGGNNAVCLFQKGGGVC